MVNDSRVEALVYIIGSDGRYIFYGTDLLGLSEEAWTILSNYKLNLVVLDQTYGEGCNQGGHLDSGQLIEIIAEMRNRRIIDDSTSINATHISHEGKYYPYNWAGLLKNRRFVLNYFKYSKGFSFT